MKKEVSPELLKSLTEYLKERERGEKTLLSFFYTEVFERELKINCGGCVEDAVRFLNQYLNKKTKPVMENFIWKGSDKATCIIKSGGTLTEVSKDNCTDDLAELIEFNTKYSHLVQRIKEAVPVEKKSLQEIKEVSKTLEVTILTSPEAKKEEETVSKKKGKQKSK